MTDNVTNLPTPGVVLDLDALERPAKDIKPPFVSKIQGVDVTFADPSDIDWRDLAAVEHPADLLRVALNADDLAHLRSIDLEAWKFNKLMEAYYNHYDLEDKIRQAKRQQAFQS